MAGRFLKRCAIVSSIEKRSGATLRSTPFNIQDLPPILTHGSASAAVLVSAMISGQWKLSRRKAGMG